MKRIPLVSLALVTSLSLPSASASAGDWHHSCEYPDRQTDLTALACNLYHEARGEIKADTMGTGFVVLNRVKAERFEDDVVDVVYRPGAFSWTNDGLSDRVYDLDAWIECLQLSGWLLNLTPGEFEMLDTTEGSLFYHRYDIEPPTWAGPENLSGRIGDHLYYLTDRKA